MPFREPENAANPVRSGGVLSLWSRSGELKSKPLSELSHVTGASRGAGCSAQFGWYRGYYSRPMERSVGRLFSSHTRSRFHKHCTPSERPFCPHTALISLAIRPGLLRKIALSADKNSRHPARPAYENNFFNRAGARKQTRGRGETSFLTGRCGGAYR